MIIHKKHILICSVLIIIAAILTAWRIPVSSVHLTSTFGETRGDHFHNGIDFGGGSQSIYAPEDGEVIYYYDRARHPFELPFGYGNSIVIAHNNGYRSHYYHLKDGSLPILTHVTNGEFIGTSGNSGHSSGTHLHLTFEDVQHKAVVNPLLFMMTNEYADCIPPAIDGILYALDDTLIPMPETLTLPAADSSVRFYIQARDKHPTSSYNIAVYKYKVEVNGELVQHITFDRLEQQNGDYAIVPKVHGQQAMRMHAFYYDNKTVSIYALNRIPGNYTVTFIVSDLNGNITTTHRTVIIQP